MKKMIYLVFSVILIFVSLYLFGIGFGVGREGGRWEPYFLWFILSLFTNLVYYIWLSKKMGSRFTVFYIPWALVMLVFLAWFFTSRPWIKHISLDFGPDPMIWDSDLKTLGFSRHALGGGRGMYGAVEFKIWEKEFWLDNAQEEYRTGEIKKLQILRRDELPRHIGYEFKGWDIERIKAAFGDPAKIIPLSVGLDKWVYEASTDRLKQEISIYVQNNKLDKIGD